MPDEDCAIYQRLLSLPGAKTSKRPLESRHTAGPPPNVPPKLSGADQAAPAPVCQECIRALFVSRAKNSSRPSALAATATSLVATAPVGLQAVQSSCPGAVCVLCQIELSACRLNASRRPSALGANTGSFSASPNRHSQPPHVDA